MKTLTAETYYKMLCSGANLLATNCETIKYLGEDVDAIYNDMWKEIKAD